MLLSMVVASSFGFPCIISLYKNAIVYLPSPTIGHQSFKGCLTSPSCCVVVRCNYFFLLAVQCAGSSLLCSGFLYAAMCLVTQSCLTLRSPMDCSPPGFSVHGDSPGQNTGVGSHALLQRIFPTQGSNPGLLHCRQILYYLSHRRSLVLLKSTSGSLQDSEHSAQPARVLRLSEDCRRCSQA